MSKTKRKCIKVLIIIILFILIQLVVLLIIYKHVQITANELDIDAVYTWVNGSDPIFKQLLSKESENRKYRLNRNRGGLSSRFDDKQELKYSLRSLEKFAPWVRHVYIVTNGHVPEWLNLTYEKVTIVTHEEIFEDKNNLPTFSSNAIETQIHRIPGLSKRFLYLNDDIFFAQEIYPEDFYSRDGFVVYLESPVPLCHSTCRWSQIGNNKCDSNCYRPECDFDGNDCSMYNMSNYNFNIQSRPLNSFTQAVLHTNRVLNRRYGYEDRKVANHAPILLDKDILEQFYKEFRQEFKETASNRLRSSNDMQLQFSYYYFIMNEKENRTLEDIFDYFDRDSSKSWCSLEIRTVMTHLYDIPLSKDNIFKFDTMVTDCVKDLGLSVGINEDKNVYDDTILNSLDISLILKCRNLGDLLLQKLGKIPKYKYTIDNSDKVDFIQINSILHSATRGLDNLRRNRKKFVCINDDIHTKRTRNFAIRKLLSDFYQSIFPGPSKFEISKENIEEKKNIEILCFILILICLSYVFIRIHCCKMTKNKVCNSFYQLYLNLLRSKPFDFLF